MTIVTDEYGDTSGLVTFEDVTEQIVGDIEGESDGDDSADNIHAISSGRWRIHAVTEIGDTDTLFGTEYSSKEADTIDGLVIQGSGHLPVRGEKVIIGNLQFIVARADNCRLHTLMTTRTRENMDESRLPWITSPNTIKHATTKAPSPPNRPTSKLNRGKPLA